MGEGYSSTGLGRWDRGYHTNGPAQDTEEVTEPVRFTLLQVTLSHCNSFNN